MFHFKRKLALAEAFVYNRSSPAVPTDDKRDDDIWVMFNGEIYNFESLKELQQKYAFKSKPTPKQ